METEILSFTSLVFKFSMNLIDLYFDPGYGDDANIFNHIGDILQGPVVQNFVSLTSSLRPQHVK